MEKEMKMEPKGPKELSREQLTGMLHQLSEQDRKLVEENRKLKGAIQEMYMTNTFKRLDYLFKVVESTDSVFSKDFIAKCAKEIEDITFGTEEPVTEE